MTPPWWSTLPGVGAVMALGWIDLVMAGIVVLSTAIGVGRGFVFEVLALAGWVAAFFAARTFAPELAPQLPLPASLELLRHGLAFLTVFLAVLFVWAIAARLVRALVRMTPLTLGDRLFGGAFGALRAIALLLAIVIAAAMTPLARLPAWRDAQAVTLLARALPLVAEWLPPALARELRLRQPAE